MMMERRDHTETVFLSFLKASFQGSAPETVPSGGDEWVSVYEMACRHSVQGLLFSVVEGLPSGSGIPAGLAAKWIADVRRIESNHARMSEIVRKQKGTWAKYGIDAVLLKGLETASMYPVPQRRQCGDIDWWIRTEADWNKALQVLENNGLAWKEDSDGDIGYQLGGVMVEHHRKGLASDGVEGRLLYLNEHILHHALVMGAGMRQLCDYAFAWRKLSGELDGARYQELLDSRGLCRWTEVLHLLLRELGLVEDGDEVIAPLSDGCSRARREAMTLLDLVMSDGNLGRYKENRFSGFRKRVCLFMKICPKALLIRWSGLFVGRIKRK